VRILKRSEATQDSNRKERTQIRLMLAYLCVATEAEASLVRKVKILDKFQLADEEIAKICGCSIGSVRNARLAAKNEHAF